MMQILENKIAIITGAGRGIGRVFALRYAEEGARLLLPDIDGDRAECVAEEIRKMGGEAFAMKTDISDEDDTAKMAEEAVRHYGRIDILLNNAAIYYGLESKPWDNWTADEWQRILSVNLIGTWLCCKAVSPYMIKESCGKIINMASDIIRVPSAQFLLPYSCSKAAVCTLTQSLARALGPSGINVNAISPGFTASEASLGQQGSNDEFNIVVGIQAIKRREEPEDLAGTAVFLASKDSDFITGQCLAVNGGATMV